MKKNTFIATTGNGLARAYLEKNVWSVEMIQVGKDVRCLACDPACPLIVYAGTQGEGVLRSRDGGKTWQLTGLAGMAVRSLAVDPHSSDTIYAGTMPANLYVSHDRGESWSEISSFRQIPGRWFWFSPAESPWKAYVQSIAISPTDPDIILAGIEYGAVVRTPDGGKTWSAHLKGALRDCHSLIFNSNHGEWIYEAGGSGNGAAVSSDAGASWQQPGNGLDRHYGWACAADPVNPGVWYVSASPSFSLRKFSPAAHIDGQANAFIFRAEDGRGWKKLDGGLPQPLKYMTYALLTDPGLGGHLYAGMANGEVWFSEDFGDHWRKLPFNLGRIQRSMIMLSL